MKEVETVDTLKAITEHGFPLYNKTTAISAYGNLHFLFAGDENGYIEVFDVQFKPICICKQKVHESSISRIIYIQEIDFMVSCSFDGVICMWNYDQKYKTIVVTLTFKVPDTHLTNLFYDKLTNEIVFTTTKHHFGSWQTFTKQYHIVETPMATISALAVVTSSTSFVITVSDNNMASAYSLPHFKLIDSWLVKDQHQNIAPSQLLVLENSLFMFGGYVSKWSIRTENSDGRKPHKGVIIGTSISADGSTIISIDSTGHISTWSLENGKKICDFQIKDVTKLTLASFDSLRKRIAVTDNSNCVRIVAATSGSLLNTIPSSIFEGKISSFCFSKVGFSGTFFVSSGTKIYDFDELPGNKMRPKHIYSGHSENISSLIILKSFYPLTIGEGFELYLWQSQTSYISFLLDAEPTIACDIPSSKVNFLVGDMNGNVNVMSIKMKTPLKVINSFGMNRQIQISSLFVDITKSVFFVGNGLGFLRIVNLNDFTFVGKIFRPHEDTVKWLDISEDYDVVVSSGYDNEIVIYHTEKECFVGRLGTVKYWNIENISTWTKIQQAPDLPYLFMSSSYSQSLNESDKSKEDENLHPVSIEIPYQQGRKIMDLDSPMYQNTNFLSNVSSFEDANKYISEIDERTSDRYKEKNRREIDNIRRRLEEDRRNQMRPKSFQVEIELFNENGKLRQINKKKKKL